MVSLEELDRLLVAGGDVVGDDGKKIGSIGEVFLDARSGEPAWVTVRTGLFGSSESFVPLTNAVARENEIHVPFTKETVKHAPRIETAGGHLSGDEERDLYRYYGLHDDDDVRAEHTRAQVPVVGEHGTSTGLGRHVRQDPTAGAAIGPNSVDASVVHAAAGPGAPPVVAPGIPRDDARFTPVAGDDVDRDVRPAVHDDDREVRPVVRDDVDRDLPPTTPDDGAMTRSEERLKVVGTERVPTERVRMRRYTVTEMKSITVPVQREEVRVEYEPADGGARGEIVDTDASGITTGDGPVDPGAPARGTDPSRQ